MKSKAFTLIELLIVVAIIAILAAIAVPNFLEAQTRSKVSRSKADMRSLVTALEAYAVDNNAYPIDGHRANDGQSFWYVPGGPTPGGAAAGVSSPIAYITSSRLIDPFRLASDTAAAYAADSPDSQYFELIDYRRYRWNNFKYTYGVNLSNPTLQTGFESVYGQWRLIGNGPDAGFNTDSVSVPPAGNLGLNVVYDPTNGTVSRGDLVRSQKHSEQPGPYGN